MSTSTPLLKGPIMPSPLGKGDRRRKAVVDEVIAPPHEKIYIFTSPSLTMMNHEMNPETSKIPEDKKGLPLKRTLITVGVCLLLSFLLLWSRGLFEATTILDRYRILSDAFFAVGLLTLCFGFLIMVAQNGALDGIRYSLQSFFKRFARKEEKFKAESYADFKARLAAKGKLNCWFLIVPGFLFLALGALFTFLFLSAEASML